MSMCSSPVTDEDLILALDFEIDCDAFNHVACHLHECEVCAENAATLFDAMTNAPLCRIRQHQPSAEDNEVMIYGHYIAVGC